MERIAVIGAGTMGRGIAHHFAVHGFRVSLIDISKEQLLNAQKNVSANLDRQIKKGSVAATQKDEIIARISFSTNIDVVSEAGMAIEAVSEVKEVKKKILGQVASYISDTAIIASNTSSISITELAKSIPHPERFAGMHFMNPVPVMKLVEIIKGYNTSEETLQKIKALTLQLDKVPVMVHDYPGFVSNRVLMPMINEAIYTLYEGVAGVSEIDEVMKLGMAHPMGPLQLADYIGLDVCLSIMNVLFEGFGNPKYAPCPLLKNMVSAGKLGTKSGEGFYEWDKAAKALNPSKRFLK